jgi:aspartyl-tRNA(Asn)/glutamyl-tRNA(Gln) amidotransferase subunit A
MDHPGAIAGSVADLAIFLQVMADSGDRVVDSWGVPEPADYTAALKEAPPYLEAGRFHGLFDDKMEPSMRKAMNAACNRLQEAGLTIIDCPLPASFSEVTTRHQQVMAVEAAAFHESRLRRHPEDYPPRIRSLIEEGLTVPAPEFARTKEHQKALTRTILDSFRDGVIMAITPATPGAAPDASSTGLPTFNSPWSYTGLPTVSFPIGWTDDGLPLSMQLVGRPWEEAELLQAASWCETAIGFQSREVE